MTLRERIKAALDEFNASDIKPLSGLGSDARELLPLVLAEMDRLETGGFRRGVEAADAYLLRVGYPDAAHSPGMREHADMGGLFIRLHATSSGGTEAK